MTIMYCPAPKPATWAPFSEHSVDMGKRLAAAYALARKADRFNAAIRGKRPEEARRVAAELGMIA